MGEIQIREIHVSGPPTMIFKIKTVSFIFACLYIEKKNFEIKSFFRSLSMVLNVTTHTGRRPRYTNCNKKTGTRLS